MGTKADRTGNYPRLRWWLPGVLVFLLAGCQGSTAGEQVPVAFSVEEERTLPAALRQAIKENEAREIRMTFEDGDDLYLIRGYGEQKTGGYSIAVDACTEDEEKLYRTTRLIGPERCRKAAEGCIVSVYRGAGGGDREEMEIQ